MDSRAKYRHGKLDEIIYDFTLSLNYDYIYLESLWGDGKVDLTTIDYESLTCYENGQEDTLSKRWVDVDIVCMQIFFSNFST